MAFNFNWSPLIADTSRAREMLTTALNKSPKPPIIVDDIIVTELNLGETPPNLDILEIGDLAEDRFRGIFKMSYTGDAFLTLKTRVQANPLNTYLSTRPSFASPQPLAADSGLTIPLAITLSEIRLSGFVILVFSRQKGMTLVFRNDPLESLKVSSTFDSIPFVRDYLQREIEKQLRNLFMEDLPAILHRLSLRMWSPEYRELDDRMMDKENDSTLPVDPLNTPPQDPVDWLNTVFEDSDLPSLSLDPSTETNASFSQKNLSRLAALSDSHRTLSLFTPPMRDTIFRAWTGPDTKATTGVQIPLQSAPTISRRNSTLGSAASIAMSDVGSDFMSRAASSATSYTFNASTSSHNGRPRKAKKRVIDLRKKKDVDDTASEAGTASTTPEPSVAPSSAPSVIYEEKDGDVDTPPRTPIESKFRRRASSGGHTPETTPRGSIALPNKISKEELRSVQPSAYAVPEGKAEKNASRKRRPAPLGSAKSSHAQSLSNAQNDFHAQASTFFRTMSADKIGTTGLSSPEGSNGGILEQAWMMKMANEIAKKVREEQSKEEKKRAEQGRSRAPSKRRDAAAETSSEDGLSDAPPAYAF
ncbi:mitochondrial distribution and morphology protein 34 [Venturia nashicola]|uniref:Mitochondrial distribution and morphology protein 34 n=1 Tax=Venturia nashicola TaxID=86259 RepID=A0A4Z1P6V4_9PEZI|nr:mitochondrial distribution and morphology protein 34 [Venturia nashicola]TLD36170.1 mitochondrial distribution and morphology protein 34 [Venturia nashicola]